MDIENSNVNIVRIVLLGKITYTSKLNLKYVQEILNKFCHINKFKFCPAELMFHFVEFENRYRISGLNIYI